MLSMIPLFLLSFTAVNAQGSVWDIINSSPNHQTLAGLLQARGLDVTLNDSSAIYTVFAPDDDAFTALLGMTQSYYNLTDDEQVTEVLLYHVLPFRVYSTDVSESLMQAETLLTYGAVPVSQLVSPAFTSEAFGAQKLNVYKLNDIVTVWGFPLIKAAVNAPDLTATNGVVHSVNAVLGPPVNPVDTLTAVNEALASDPTSPSFDIILALINDFELVDTVNGVPGMTLFIPTDDAFNTLLDAAGLTPDDLTVEVVSSLLFYHLTLEIYAPAQYVRDNCPISANCLLRSAYKMPLSASKNGVWVGFTVGLTTEGAAVTDSSGGQATIVAVDYLLSNGIAHIIDAVLVPEGFGFVNMAAVVINDPDFSTLVGIATLPGFELILELLVNGTGTLVAPTNDAFAELGVDATTAAADVDATLQILSYHWIDDFGAPGALVNSWFAGVATGYSEYVVSTALSNGCFFDIGGDGSSSNSSNSSDSSSSSDSSCFPMAQRLGVKFLNDNLHFYPTGPTFESTAVASGAGIDIWATNGVIQKVNKVLLPPLMTTDVLNAGGFATLSEALVQAQLAEDIDVAISGGGPLTIIAPTDEAFAKISETVAGLNNWELNQVLLNHVLGQPLYIPDCASEFGGWGCLDDECNAQSFMTAQGDMVLSNWCNVEGVLVNITFQVFNGPGEGVYGEIALVEMSQLITANAIVYTVDEVLVPETLMPTSVFDILEYSGSTGTLFDLISGYEEFLPPGGTLFAPSDAAFDVYLTTLGMEPSPEQVGNILAYHILEAKVMSGDVPTEKTLVETFLNCTNLGPSMGECPPMEDMPLVYLDGAFQKIAVMRDGSGGVMVGPEAQVTEADQMDTDQTWVVHFVDRVLAPPMGIVTVALNAGYTTVLELAIYLNLVDTVLSLTSFTAFFPTNDAFATLLAPWGGSYADFDNSTLTSILLYHLVPVPTYSAAVGGNQLNGVPTFLAGQTLDIDGTSLTISTASGGSAMLVAADLDILMNAGVVHGIDAVLLPANITLPEVPSTSPSPSPGSSASASVAAASASPSESPDDFNAAPGALVPSGVALLLAMLVAMIM